MIKKRCFIAFNLSKKVKDKIFNWSKNYRKRFINAKWVDKENLHITDHFLGYLEKAKIEKVGEVLKNIKKPDNIKIKVKKIDCFPKKERTRVLFLKVMERNNLLENLHKRVERALVSKIDYKPSKKIWVPHITLARFKKPKKITLDYFNDFNGEDLIESIDLMESKLSPKGPKYFILKKYQFN
ncbi:MAG TPA: RNA 2',3'-cyclic phosphodiesterase [Patescibacteria group bacterium]|nr:RNA 2',3'-cyclic phosphodiesterase [Patescibacteria group bacterium]